MATKVASQCVTNTGYIAQFKWNNTVAASPFNVILSPSCVHRDFEKLHDSPISGSVVFKRLRTAISFRKWNNKTSSWYRSFCVCVRHSPWLQVLPTTGDVWSRPFHRGKQTESTEVHIYIAFGEGPRKCIGNITLSILDYKIVDFKDITVKFKKLRCVRPCSSVGTK